MSQKVVPIKTIPFAGGVDLAHEAAALPNGALSQDQNFRPRRPGKESRLGHAKKHTTTEHSTKDIISLYGFSKAELQEWHFFSQLSDGSVDVATNNPPVLTTGNFGSSVLSARSAPWPASWAKFRDLLIYTDGADKGQIYTGQNMKPVLFNVYKTATAIPDVPEEGADYTQEVIDDLTATRASLDILGTLANDALFIGFDVPVDKITFNVPNANTNASVATLYYRKNDSTWADASASDGTADSGKSFNNSGSFTWTLPTDEIQHYSFGRSCFIYKIEFSAAFDAEVDVSAVTGEYTTGFQDIQNVWDGIMPEATMALVEDSSEGTFATYSSQAILCGDLVGGASHDYIYISSPDPLFGMYLDVLETPNTTATTTIDQIATWTGAAFTNLSSVSTNDGGASTGFITWARNTSIRKLNFNGTVQHAYWYRIRFDQTLSSSLAWSVLCLPYFDINNIYPVQQAVCAWDNRLWYSFNTNMLYGTDWNKPMTLNGDNLVMIEAAKHSKNKAICMRRFYQFMLVWGEERGEEGGYFSIIQPGTTATGYDSQIISERIGIMNNKCAVTLEDTDMSDLNTERPIMKGVFFLSRAGVYKSDGSFLKNISGAINNYFDPTRSTCIRRGFEKEHFLSWDSAYGVLRLGIVSGSSATVPNKFFIYDPTGGTWHEDELGQPLSSIAEVDGAGGSISVLQYGGGQDGFVYKLNTTNDDVSTAIDKSIKIELDGEGHLLHLKAMAFVFKSQAAGDIIVDVYRKGESATAHTYTISMINASADYRGKRFNCDVTGDHLTIRLRNNTASQPVYLLEHGFDIEKIENNVAYD